MNIFKHRRFKDLVMEQLDAISLSEGLVSTYDAAKLQQEIRRILSHKIEKIVEDSPGEDLVQTKFGRVFTVLVVLKSPLTQDEEIKLNQILNLYGYTNSRSAWDKLVLQLEPKYPVQMNDELSKNNVTTLYHITQQKYISKIQKRGLIPRDSETTFDHPGDRIYLLWLVQGKYSIKELLNSVIRTLASNKKLKPNEMIALEIKYNPNNPYYIDDTITSRSSGLTGLFTTKNIPPQDIRVSTKNK